MFALTIVFGPTGTTWRLLWRNKENAEAAFGYYEKPTGLNLDTFNITDDFGQHCLLLRRDIHGAMLEDMDQSMNAHIQSAMHQARMQAKGQEAAETDPVLRAARARSGPAILTPGMPANGGFR